MKNMIIDYQSGVGLTTIMRRYKMGYPRIKKILTEAGVETRKPTWHGQKERDSRIIKLYQSGNDMNIIADKLGLHRLTIGIALKRNNINSRNGHPKYPIDPTICMDFPNELSSYWFGFLCGDGCIHQDKSNRLRLLCKLQYGDIQHLHNFAKDLRTTKIPRKIERKKSTLPGAREASFNPACELSIHNQDISVAYLDNGWRSFKNGFQDGNNIKKINVRHFLRGFMDADGLVYEQNCWQGGYKNKTKKIKKLTVGYCSPHEKVLEWVRYFIFMNLDLRSYNKIGYNKVNKKKNGMFELIWTGENSVKIARWLYLSQSRCLQRKFDKVRPYIFGSQ